jgi:hypothetical protein
MTNSLTKTRKFQIFWDIARAKVAGQLGTCPGHQPVWVAKYLTGTIGNMGLLTSHFHERKYFSENYQQLKGAPSTIYSSSVLGRKNLKTIGLTGCQVIHLPGRRGAHLGPALHVPD